MAFDLQGVIRWLKVRLGCDVGNEITDPLLLTSRNVHIRYRTAVHANEVMVVPGEPLGQLVAGEPLGPEVMRDDTRLLEDGQGSIQRREGHPRTKHCSQLGGRHRAGGVRQCVDDGLTALGETQIVIEEPQLDLTFHGRFGHWDILVIMILNIMITILISTLRSRALPLSLVAILTLSACGAGESTTDELHVVVTTSIWGDVVSQIVGEDAAVEVLIPRGTDPHEYQPTPRQVASLSEADLVVANGLGLEEGLHDVLDAAASDGANLLELAPQLDPLQFPEHAVESHHEAAGDHEHDDLDPHVWFDPARVDRAAGLIAAELTAIDDSVDWHARAIDYSGELLAVADEMERMFDSVPEANRKLVTNHDALGYLADRFGFEVIGVVIPGGSTLSEPSSSELAELVAIIQQEQVPAIFAETSESGVLADAVAAEVGNDVEVIVLYTGSLGELGSDAGELTGMLLTDARLIADGLS